MPSLATLLRLDAAACLLLSLALVLGAGPLARLTHLPETLLLAAGLLLVPCAVLMAWTANEPARRIAWARFVVAGNAAWCVASLVVLLPVITSPNAWGFALVLTQALAVAGLAVLETKGIGRVAQHLPSPA